MKCTQINQPTNMAPPFYSIQILSSHPSTRNTSTIYPTNTPHCPFSDNIFPKSSCQQVRPARICLALCFVLFTYLKFCNSHFNKSANKYGTAIFAPALRGINCPTPLFFLFRHFSLSYKLSYKCAPRICPRPAGLLLQTPVHSTLPIVARGAATAARTAHGATTATRFSTPHLNLWRTPRAWIVQMPIHSTLPLVAGAAGT